METLLRLIGGVAWDHVVMALLHSLWKGAAVAVVVYALLRVVPARRVDLRYGLALAGFLAVPLAALVTFSVLGGAATTEAPAVVYQAPGGGGASAALLAAPAGDAGGSAAPRASEPTRGPISRRPATGAPPSSRPSSRWAWAAGLWLAGTVLMLGRAAWLVKGAGRLRRGCRLITDERLAAPVDQLRRALGITRPVRVAAGDGVRVPAVLGVVWPVILLPAAIANGMPVEQLRMILAHELAHVRRHDYLVNLLQLLVEAALFFNPAAWWLSRQVRVEREACCDALAVRATGGETARYVRTLADAMAAMLRPTVRHALQPGLGLTPAMAGDGEGGSMLDRARRVLVPAYRPQVRLSWPALLVTALAAAVLLAGAWGGTRAAVRAAERLLSPAERVEKMAKLQDELGSNNGRGHTDQGEEAVLSGTVRTADGRPLPPGTQLTASSTYRHGTSGYSLDVDKDGRFSRKVKSGRASVWVAAPGYAPAFVGQLAAEADAQGLAKYPPVELVLTEGFEGQIRLRGAGGKPVAGAKVVVAHQMDLQDTSNPYGAKEYVTDDQGLVRVPHSPDRPARVTAEVPGYQYDQVVVRMEPGKVTEAELLPAKPTAGVVTDTETGKPLAGVAVSLLRREGFDGRTWYQRGPGSAKPPLLARTDEAGRFVLDTLRDDSTYTLWVTATGRGGNCSRASAPASRTCDGRSGLPAPSAWRSARTRARCRSASRSPTRCAPATAYTTPSSICPSPFGRVSARRS
jgi:beta-lactamase regulating signal transducer with metallopeptidase domain